MIFGCARPVFSGMADISVDLVFVNFTRCKCFGCLFPLILEWRAFWMYVCLNFQLLLLGGQKSGVVCYLIELGA